MFNSVTCQFQKAASSSARYEEHTITKNLWRIPYVSNVDQNDNAEI